ncbi:hybrid sensor histidine kinase/response regulator [Scytonema hofmannii PCC 7110]|uniref:histidine kinase n=1 Tax=Scytonema hofmannii PCC 7110 TaxID=128403 RepID=A0A139XHG9_9CYAN|nr:response regulator [Scytonema hofmannii]KYC44146.1 hybrid sensor histidine kinase/response regulator [Scytonema hofmannii PCC 7110]
MSAKILVVDDELLIKRLISQYFRKKVSQQEYEFIFANNGKEALEQIQTHSDIDLVLTDINMPEMDGLTLLNKLRESSYNFRTVVVSAYGDMKTIRQAMNQGAFDFINKPIDFQDLEITITRTLDFVQSLKEVQSMLQQAEIQIIQNEKMSAIGKMLAGIAHEINNPVCFISGNLHEAEAAIQNITHHLQLYQQNFSNLIPEIKEHSEEIDVEYLLEELPKMLASMKVGSERLRLLSASLCNFSRGDHTNKLGVNIHEGIESTLMILRHRLKGNEKRPAIEVIREYGDLPLVQCYPGSLYQVFMNIITNAIDALNEASVHRSYAEMETHPCQIRIKTEVLEGENAAIVRIHDNGIGMSDEVKERVFEHLFTTKAVSKGTGLGLSISRQIVEEKHGGCLTCDSTLAEGAEFMIQIPLL